MLPARRAGMGGAGEAEAFASRCRAASMLDHGARAGPSLLGPARRAHLAGAKAEAGAAEILAEPQPQAPVWIAAWPREEPGAARGTAVSEGLGGVCP